MPLAHPVRSAVLSLAGALLLTTTGCGGGPAAPTSKDAGGAAKGFP